MRIRFHLSCRLIFGPLWAILVLAGCVASPDAVAPRVPDPARLAIVNLTPHSWKIVVSAVAGGESREVRVESRATVELELAGGDYQVEQVLLALPGQGEAAPRRFPTRLEPGQTYHWPLATLGADAEEDDVQTGGGAR